MGRLDRGCVLDTNILIYHLDGKLPEMGEQLLEQAFENNACYSLITRIELMGWKKHTPDSLRDARDLLASLREQVLNEPLVEKCIALRRSLMIKLPDAIIAATALHLNLPLVTRNTSDFQSIENLQLIDPFSSQE